MRGVIADVKKGYAVLLNEHGEFVKIKDKNYMIGDKINFKFKTYKFIYTMAASFAIFLMLGATGFTIYNTPSSYVSIDINPSMQLGLNFMDRVVKAVPFNDDAKKVLANVDIKNKNVDELVNSIVDEAKDLGYLNEKNNSVVIDVLSDKEELKDKITDATEDASKSGVNVSVEKANKQQFELSKQLNVSLGRAKAILDYTNTFGGSVTENKDTLKNETVGNIRKTINTKKNNIPNQSKASEDKNNQSNVNSNTENKTTEKKYESPKPSVNNAKPEVTNPRSSEVKENINNGNSEKEKEQSVQSSSNKPVKEEVKPESKPQNGSDNAAVKQESAQSNAQTKQESAKPEKTNESQGKGSEKSNNGKK